MLTEGYPLSRQPKGELNAGGARVPHKKVHGPGQGFSVDGLTTASIVAHFFWTTTFGELIKERETS